MAHGLFTFKLCAFDFDMNALTLIFNYQIGKKQRVKINFTCHLCNEHL